MNMFDFILKYSMYVFCKVICKKNSEAKVKIVCVICMGKLGIKSLYISFTYAKFKITNEARSCHKMTENSNYISTTHF